MGENGGRELGFISETKALRNTLLLFSVSRVIFDFLAIFWLECAKTPRAQLTTTTFLAFTTNSANYIVCSFSLNSDGFFFEQIMMDFKINLGREVFQFPTLKNAKAT